MNEPTRLFIPKQEVTELANKLHETIYSYKGQLSLAEVLGIIELVKYQIMQDEVK